MSVGVDVARQELLKVLREFLAKREPDLSVRGGAAARDRAWWRQLAGLGVFSLAVPAERGGLGFGLREAAGAFEVFGEARAPGPLVWTQLAALTLPAAASGEWVVAGADLAGRDPEEPILIAHGDCADRLLTLSERGVVVHERAEVDATILAAPIDPETPVVRIDALGDGELVAGPAAADRLRRIGTLLTAATLVGLSEAALRLATDYATSRHQFDRPIGSFQAVKHLLADAYTRTALARAAVYAAAELEDTDRSRGVAVDLPAAKLLAGRAADANARAAVQVFGGMGFAAETQPHLVLKRAWVLEHEFGTMADHALAVSALFAADGAAPARAAS